MRNSGRTQFPDNSSTSAEDAIFLGVDLGTSGARVVAMSFNGAVVGQGAAKLETHGIDWRDPLVWWTTVRDALSQAIKNIDRQNVVSICVDGTSGTVLAVDENGAPLSRGRMYNDICADGEIVETIFRLAPATSAAHGVTSGLAKALQLRAETGCRHVLHQADWIAGQLCGVFSSDENNALKTGYDPVSGTWPDWIAKTGIPMSVLPDVHAPGTPIGQISNKIAQEFLLPRHVEVVAGTTDGCASFLATGAKNSGDGVSVLGSTLTIKLLCDVPIFDPGSGVYSHHILGKWLVGGASNSGGKVLLEYFNPDELAELSKQFDPEIPTDLDYYPLTEPGERFPVNDAGFQPVLSPVPEDKAVFLQGMLEGISRIEAMAYDRLMQLGAPKLQTVRTVGGGAQNAAWLQIRKRVLPAKIVDPLHHEAAYGAAILAQYGRVS